MQNKTVQDLLDRCKCGVRIIVNQHRDYYTPIKQYLEEIKERVNITEEERERIIKTDTHIELHFYPDNPVGFYQIHGSNLQELINEACGIIDEERREYAR
jgi:hypothetical protein